MNWLKKKAFFVISRVGLPLYSTFPIFGRLKGSFGVIEKDGRVLMIERNDGRGLCFPGGLGMPWESEEKTLRREVLEETGMRVEACRFLLGYDTSVGVPVRLSAFEVEAEGEIRGSWEGTPCWVKLEEAVPRILRSQRRVVDELLKRGGSPR